MAENSVDVEKAKLRKAVTDNFRRAVKQWVTDTEIEHQISSLAYDNLRIVSAAVGTALHVDEQEDRTELDPRIDALMIALLVSLTEWLDAEWSKQNV